MRGEARDFRQVYAEELARIEEYVITLWHQYNDLSMKQTADINRLADMFNALQDRLPHSGRPEPGDTIDVQALLQQLEKLSRMEAQPYTIFHHDGETEQSKLDMAEWIGRERLKSKLRGILGELEKR